MNFIGFGLSLKGKNTSFLEHLGIF